MNKILSAGRPSARKTMVTKLSDVSEVIEYKRVNFDLSVEQHAKLKTYAAKNGLTITQILTEFIAKLPD